MCPHFKNNHNDENDGDQDHKNDPDDEKGSRDVYLETEKNVIYKKLTPNPFLQKIFAKPSF